MNDWIAMHYLSAQELANKMAQQELSSVEITRHFLNRIAEYNDKDCIYTSVFEEQALALAENADRLRKAGIVLSPFHGVPVSIKEHFDYQGSVAHYGSKARLNCVSEKNSAVVDKLIALGMVILGKTSMTEFAFGLAGQNPTVGTAHNPWDLNELRSPGGSSAGAGAALALGLCPISLGGDTGGSVRAPAAHTYTIGFKPSSGMISRADAMPLSPTLDVVGIVARTVEDSEIMTKLLSGPDLNDDATLSTFGLAAQRNFMADSNAESTTSKKLYCLNEAAWPYAVNADYAVYWQNTIDGLKEQGYEIIDWQPNDLGFFKQIGDDNSVVLAYEAYQHYGDLVEDPTSDVWLTVRNRILNGKNISIADYEKTLEDRKAYQAAFRKELPENAVLLLPAMDQAAQTLDFEDVKHTGLGAFLRPANFIDAPAITLPSGFDSENMPLSIQLIAHTANDHVLLLVAKEVEASLGNTRKVPKL